MRRERTKSVPSLADDLLNGAEAIAEYTNEPVRRVLHLISHHGLPHFKRGQRIYSRKTWLDRYYSGEAPERITQAA